MKIADDTPVVVTTHAEAQARSRYPEWALMASHDLKRRIGWEVADGIRAGRVSKTQPRSTVDAGAERRKTRLGHFVTSETGTRVYLVKRSENAVVVVTAYPVLTRAAA